MVYIILNGLLCVFLIAYSYAVDRNKMIEFGMTVNSILFLFSYTLTVFLNLLLINFFPNYTMMYMLVRVSEILEKFFLLLIKSNREDRSPPKSTAAGFFQRRWTI